MKRRSRPRINPSDLEFLRRTDIEQYKAWTCGKEPKYHIFNPKNGEGYCSFSKRASMGERWSLLKRSSEVPSIDEVCKNCIESYNKQIKGEKKMENDVIVLNGVKYKKLVAQEPAPIFKVEAIFIRKFRGRTQLDIRINSIGIGIEPGDDIYISKAK